MFRRGHEAVIGGQHDDVIVAADSGVDIVEGLCNRPWGLREFTVRDPNGVLIKVGHIIPAFVEEDSLLAT